jgi:CRP-like cAMP-binding protein
MNTFLDSLLGAYAPETRTLASGDPVFGADDPNAYLVLSGSIDIYTPGVGVARYLVGRVEAGDFLGE